MRYGLKLLFASLLAGLGSGAMADGLTLKLEGGLGFNRGENVGIFSLVRTPPASSTSQLDYSGGMPRGPLSLSYRAEGSWAFDLGNGTRMRIGGVLSGVDGSYSEATPVYYIVTARPDGPGDLVVGEISVCSFPDPCVLFEGDLSRSYREIMPELMFGRDGADGSTTWVGLQGFSGQLSEDTSNQATRIAGGGFPIDRTTLTELDADMQGLMLAVQHERQLDSGLNLLLGAGLGRYTGDASGFSVEADLPASAKAVFGSFDGTRAQLAVGVEKPIGKGLTLGATVRADYWSDQPRIKMDWSTPPCSPTLCEPPFGSGRFNLATDPFTTLTVGLSLTFRM